MKKEEYVIYEQKKTGHTLEVSIEKHKQIKDFIKPDGDRVEDIKRYSIKIFDIEKKLIEEGEIADYELINRTVDQWDETAIWSITIKRSDGIKKIYRMDEFETWEAEPPIMKNKPL